jgi:hypothetical protein
MGHGAPPGLAPRIIPAGLRRATGAAGEWSAGEARAEGPPGKTAEPHQAPRRRSPNRKQARVPRIGGGAPDRHDHEKSGLLLDDGELDDVRALLEEFGEPFVHLRGAEIPIRVEEPSRLLIATSRRAVLARGWPGTPGGASPEKVAVVTEDSNTLRSMLRRIGFHLMIRRPVHPYALRLVLLRALYRGSERRRDVRLPFGCEISVRSGLRRRSATLAELSTRGCRLLSNHVFGVGTRVTLQLPPEVAGGRGLALRAKVLRTRAEGDECRAVALSFVDVDASARAQLSQLLKERAEGPVKLAQRQASAARPLPTRPASDPKRTIALPPAPSGDEERRKHRRAAFREQVMTLGERASLILMGRDISAGACGWIPRPAWKRAPGCASRSTGAWTTNRCWYTRAWFATTARTGWGSLSRTHRRMWPRVWKRWWRRCPASRSSTVRQRRWGAWSPRSSSSSAPEASGRAALRSRPARHRRRRRAVLRAPPAARNAQEAS